MNVWQIIAVQDASRVGGSEQLAHISSLVTIGQELAFRSPLLLRSILAPSEIFRDTGADLTLRVEYEQ